MDDGDVTWPGDRWLNGGLEAEIVGDEGTKGEEQVVVVGDDAGFMG